MTTQHTTETGICNQALGLLGANQISNVDSDTSVEAILCRLNYAELRDAVLEEGRWTFARRSYTSVTQGRVQDTWKFAWKYPIHADILLVLRVFPLNTDGSAQASWEREENFILTDLDAFNYDTIVRVVDPRKFTTTFRQALVYRLAAELAIGLKENLPLYNSLMDVYSSRATTALSIDGMQGRSEQTVSSRLSRSRHNLG